MGLYSRAIRHTNSSAFVSAAPLLPDGRLFIGVVFSWAIIYEGLFLPLRRVFIVFTKGCFTGPSSLLQAIFAFTMVALLFYLLVDVGVG